jgi:hypothetical protein
MSKEQTYFQLSPTLFLLARHDFDDSSNHSGLNSSINYYSLEFSKYELDE